jgi:hypothetical protein
MRFGCALGFCEHAIGSTSQFPAQREISSPDETNPLQIGLAFSSNRGLRAQARKGELEPIPEVSATTH